MVKKKQRKRRKTRRRRQNDFADLNKLTISIAKTTVVTAGTLSMMRMASSLMKG